MKKFKKIKLILKNIKKSIENLCTNSLNFLISIGCAATLRRRYAWHQGPKNWRSQSHICSKLKSGRSCSLFTLVGGRWGCDVISGRPSRVHAEGRKSELSGLSTWNRLCTVGSHTNRIYVLTCSLLLIASTCSRITWEILDYFRSIFFQFVLNAGHKSKSLIQSNLVITNRSGPTIFVRYNRGSL